MTMSDEREEGDQPEPDETRRGLPVLVCRRVRISADGGPPIFLLPDVEPCWLPEGAMLADAAAATRVRKDAKSLAHRYCALPTRE
jgi:hypothetical protein